MLTFPVAVNGGITVLFCLSVCQVTIHSHYFIPILVGNSLNTSEKVPLWVKSQRIERDCGNIILRGAESQTFCFRIQAQETRDCL